MSILRYESVVRTVEDIYQFKLSNISISTQDVFFVNGSDDDRSDFELMWKRLNKENKEHFKELMVTIFTVYYKNQSPEGIYTSRTEGNQTVELKVEYYDRYSPYGLKVIVSSTDS